MPDSGGGCLPFRSRKLKGITHLRDALKHNLRETAEKIGSYNNISIAEMHRNVRLRGLSSSKEIVAYATRAVELAGLKSVRKDAVWGIEVVFMCHPSDDTDLTTFFEQCTAWAESQFEVEVLSSIVHLDQGSPHCHVILLPLISGRMRGGKVHGNRGQLSQRIEDFYAQVGMRFGLSSPPKRRWLSRQERTWHWGLLMDHFAVNTPFSMTQIKKILSPHFSNPLPLLEMLGLAPKRAKVNAVTRLMTRPVLAL